ncbi:MAG TPA: C39 family peptidase [Terriglobales bacterium]|nr:C39 family peptidase [Terriglobales bacterium]
MAKAIAISLCFCTLLFATDQGIWLDVPFVQQTKDGCGAASIAMVMQYWMRQSGRQPTRDADATYIYDQLHSREAHGIYASGMERYLQEQGYRTFVLRGQWSDLEQHLRKGRPLIVALKPIGNSRALHYVVVAGVDAARNLVLFNDPAGRKLEKLDRRTFEKEWNVTGKWTLLAVPQS